MPSFRYQARTADAQIVSGIVEAPTIEAGQEALEERQYEVLSIEEQSGAGFAVESFVTFLNRVTAKELVASIRMLAVMVSASLPLPESVRNIARQTKNPKFKLIMTDVANEIEGGSRLSDALDKYPSTFSQFFINMIRSGETTGQLAEVLNYLADQQERDYDLMSKMRGALIYPAIIVSGMGISGVVMMVYVVPKLTQVLTESGVALPWTTQLLIGTSHAMVTYWWIFILGIISFASVFIFWKKSEYGSYQWDVFKMHVPVIGPILKEMYLVRFCQSMATLMKGGLTLVQALEIAANVIGNHAWKAMIIETIQTVNDGQSVVAVMARKKYVPQMAVQMIAVGEESGRLQEVLFRISEFYTRSVSNASANMLTLIEPLVMIILGLGVGIMVAAIMVPLYNMSSGI